MPTLKQSELKKKYTQIESLSSQIVDLLEIEGLNIAKKHILA